MKITLVLNRKAGTLRGRDPEREAQELARIFRRYGHDVNVEVHAGPSLAAAIERVCRERLCEAIVVGGGDGTVSTAAAAAAKAQLALGVLPLGTMNLFARSLRIPLTMVAAAEALAAGHVTPVDVGEVNGRLFIHHVSLGLHPRIVRLRERLSYSSRLGKIRAGVQAWWTVLRQPPSLHARITVDQQVLDRRTTAILVSNNRLGEGHLPYADDLGQGKLGLYVTPSRQWHDLIELAARMSLGEFSANPLLESWQAEQIEISLDRSALNVSLDGELVAFQLPLRFFIRKSALLVLRPNPPPVSAREQADGLAPNQGELTVGPGTDASVKRPS